MSEEIIQPITEEQIPAPEPSDEPAPASREELAAGFKSVSTRIGISMIIMFVLRFAATFIVSALAQVIFDNTLIYIANVLVSIVFVYLIPITITYFIMRRPLKESGHRLYNKPKYVGKALGMFPALYGTGIGINIITMGLLTIVSLIIGGDGTVENPIFSMQASTPVTAVIMFVDLAIIAPLFEEFWFRGIFMQSLRRYGNGVAIMISAILFGLTHGNFQQIFYATAVGIVLGYIATVTDSIITSTILHAMLNSVAGILMLFMVDPSVSDAMTSAMAGTQPEITPLVAAFAVYMVLVMVLLIVGIVMAIYKLAKIKRYKVPKVQYELSAKSRWGLFFSRVPVIVMLVLCAAYVMMVFLSQFANL